MATRGAVRNALGDITKLQNIPLKVETNAKVSLIHFETSLLASFLVSLGGNQASGRKEDPHRCGDRWQPPHGQDPACWRGGHRPEGPREPPAVRRVHPGHVRLPQVGLGIFDVAIALHDEY